MSKNHDTEIHINTYDTDAFFHYIIENYDLSQIEMTKKIGNEHVVIKYNMEKHYILVDNIRHAAMAWNAAFNNFVSFSHHLNKEEK